MRIFLADFGDLLGPLLLVLFAVLPRVFGSKKKAKKAAQKPVTPSSQPEEYKVPEYVEVGGAPPPPPPQPEREMPELAEVLRELLGQNQTESEVQAPYAAEPEPEPVSLEVVAPTIEEESHHALPINLISRSVKRSRSRRKQVLMGDRFSLRQAILLREILGPPRSLQPLEKWENGGS